MSSFQRTSLSLISLFAGLVGVFAYYAGVAEGGRRTLESFSSSSSSNSSSSNTKQQRHSNTLSKKEQWIKSSILETMPPAARLGITIGELSNENFDDETYLSLQMPLQGNTNIHGTAFAGSLYSLAALCAWYAITIRLRRAKRLSDDCYTVVLKSAEISYLRPVADAWIVATSQFPTAEEFGAFLEQLQRSGKATIHVNGKIRLEDGKDAVHYTAVICVFKPHQTDKARLNNAA
jgi:thioesterase domain-containing protein